VFHAKATTATIRRHLIAVPARIATSARRLTLHLPRDWPWQDGWEQLFASTCGPPPSPTLTTRLQQAQARTHVEEPDRSAATHAHKQITGPVKPNAYIGIRAVDSG